MEEFDLELCVRVKVQAYDLGDAMDIVRDTFGTGDDGVFEVVELQITER